MRRAVLSLALLVVLAGCAAPFAEGPAPAASPTPAGGADGAASDGPTVGTAGDGATSTPRAEPRPDPETDVLGWEDGYWYDDPVAVTTADGLNESERSAVVARAMARVETVRKLEFERRVPVEVVSRANFSAGGTDRESSAFTTFDNAKFEALFLVGEESDSLAVQESSRNQTVLGYYSPAKDAIVVVSEAETPTLDGERTLSHELVHALQDQHFNLSDSPPRTRDAYNARNGLVEGDASVVQHRYQQRCGANWSCLAPPESNGSGGGGGPPNMGVYLLSLFPYTEGPSFVRALQTGGEGWAAVNDAYDSPPRTTTEVINPEQFGRFSARAVSLAPNPTGGWERVRPPGRPDYATLGQSGLATMFAQTLYDDYNRSSVVRPQAFLNLEGGSVNTTDPLNYGLAPTEGWRGDRLQVYRNGAETGYVWRIVWDDEAAAARFAAAYRDLLAHWGGQRVGADTWKLADSSPFADAVSLEVEGETVTIVNAPTEGDLGSLYEGAR
ncbi:Hvo_1808 family surface protein [Halobacteriales archaeon Cl-PHB]